MITITKYFELGLLVSGILVIFTLGCNKSKTKPCLDIQYSFAITSEWSPQQEIYHVGDTIYLTSIFPKLLTDQVNSSVVVNYSNSVGIQGDLGIGYLDTITDQPIPARDSFQIFSLKGSFSERPGSQNVGLNFNYYENSENYEFRAAFVCRKIGIYTIGLSDLFSNGLRGENCTNAGFNKAHKYKSTSFFT